MGAIQEVRANVDMNTINIGTEYNKSPATMPGSNFSGVTAIKIVR